MNPRVYMPILNEAVKSLRQQGKDTTLPTILLETAEFLEQDHRARSDRFPLVNAIPLETLCFVEERIGTIAEFLNSEAHGVDMEHAY